MRTNSLEGGSSTLKTDGFYYPLLSSVHFKRNMLGAALLYVIKYPLTDLGNEGHDFHPNERWLSNGNKLFFNP